MLSIGGRGLNILRSKFILQESKSQVWAMGERPKKKSGEGLKAHQ